MTEKLYKIPALKFVADQSGIHTQHIAGRFGFSYEIIEWKRTPGVYHWSIEGPFYYRDQGESDSFDEAFKILNDHYRAYLAKHLIEVEGTTCK